MAKGFARPGAGSKHGSKAGETAYTRKMQKLAGKILFKKTEDRKPRVEREIEKFLDADDSNNKDKDTKFKMLLRLIDIAAGTPHQMAPGKMDAKEQPRVLVLPEKDTLEAWMGRQGQTKVIEKVEKKPN